MVGISVSKWPTRALIPTNCWKNIRRTPICVRRQHPRLKQPVHETTSFRNLLSNVLFCSSGCLRALDCWWKTTSARISYHSCLTRWSDTDSWRSLAKLNSASSFRPLDTSHRGEKGRNEIPRPNTSPGISCRTKGKRLQSQQKSAGNRDKCAMMWPELSTFDASPPWLAIEWHW